MDHGLQQPTVQRKAQLTAQPSSQSALLRCGPRAQVHQIAFSLRCLQRIPAIKESLLEKSADAADQGALAGENRRFSHCIASLSSVA